MQGPCNTSLTIPCITRSCETPASMKCGSARDLLLQTWCFLCSTLRKVWSRSNQKNRCTNCQTIWFLNTKCWIWQCGNLPRRQYSTANKHIWFSFHPASQSVKMLCASISVSADSAENSQHIPECLLPSSQPKLCAISKMCVFQCSSVLQWN